MGLLNGALGSPISGFGFLASRGVFLVPNLAQDLFTISKVSTIGAEDFQSDRAVVTDGL